MAAQPIKRVLQEKGISQHKTAVAVGLGDADINKVVNGRHVPSATLVQRLVQFLGVPATELFDNLDGSTRTAP